MKVELHGGVGTFGRNCSVVEDEGFRLGIDCGVAFGPSGPATLPDLDALGRVDAWVVTHAHEDHVGGLAYLPKTPTLASDYTRRALSGRGRELPAAGPTGPFEVQLVPVQHSIPGSAAVVVKGRAGSLVFSGDLRLSPEPLVGQETDLDALASAAGPDPLALFCDSTNAGVPGENPGDRAVIAPILRAAETTTARVVVATFSSHVERVAALAEVCRKTKRRLILLGRGLLHAVEAAMALELVELSDVLSPVHMLKSFEPGRTLVVVSGTQGEANSGALRLAHGEHRRLQLAAGDLFIHSARVIPGYEARVDEMLSAVRARGARVLDGREGRHVSGHGHARDLELVHAALGTRVVPVHGADPQLEAQAGLAEAAGLEAVRARDGDTLLFARDLIEVQRAKPRWMEVVGGVPRSRADQG